MIKFVRVQGDLMEVINTCRIDYMYRMSNTSPVISKTIVSNMVSTKVIRDRIKISKYVNKEKANSFDVLIYIVEIYNISSYEIKNLFFYDNIPNGTSFIENTVTVNGMKIRCVNPLRGFSIGDLKSGDKIQISFKVLVLQSYLIGNITNKSSIDYDYLFNIEKPPIKVSKESNSVITEYKKELFNQVVVQNNIKLSSCIDQIVNVKSEAEIINTKVIDGYNLNGCELLVLGKLKYQILYMVKREIKCYEEVFGFSVCMIVPSGVVYLNEVNANVNIEDVNSNLINKKIIFISSTLLIYC